MPLRETVAAVALLATLIGPESANDARVLWAATRDAPGIEERAVDVAVDGTRIAVAAGLVAGGGSSRFAVRAHDVSTGALVWEDLPALGKPSEAAAVDVRSGVAVVVGWRGAPEESDLVVRAYDVRSGTPRWSHVDAAENVAAVALSPPYAVVAGLRRLGDDPEDPTDLLVRAHDLRTGRVVWTDAYDGGERDAVNAIAVGGRVAVIAGSVRRQYDAPIVRAYDLVDGTVLWTDRPATADHDTRALDVVIRSGTAVVAGTLHSSHGVLAYDARRGTPLWRHDDGMISGAPWAVAAVPGQARVLVAPADVVCDDPARSPDGTAFTPTSCRT